MMLRARDRKTWANSAPSDRHTFVPYFSWEFPAQIVSLMLRFRMKSSYSLREVFAVALGEDTHDFHVQKLNRFLNGLVGPERRRIPI